MRYVSLFSGVEAASLAWGPLGFEPMAFSEIDPFPCAVLAERFSDVPNLGDVAKIDWGEFIESNGRPDVVVGGSPCQSFSIAGTRTGLKGASGLMFEYIRAVRELVPRWLREFYGPACCDACLCMHPERAHQVWVGRDDSPYRNDSTRNARMCPIKAREMGVSQ